VSTSSKACAARRCAGEHIASVLIWTILDCFLVGMEVCFSAGVIADFEEFGRVVDARS